MNKVQKNLLEGFLKGGGGGGDNLNCSMVAVGEFKPNILGYNL